MSALGSVRAARFEDVPAMAQVHVQSWRETFRGVMSDEILDAPNFLARRAHLWTAALTDERYASNRAAVAEVDDAVVGIAMSGPALDEDAPVERQLYVLYLLEAFHGSGLGNDLLDAVLEAAEATSLWVADPIAPVQARYRRAHAFYRKHGFEPDGAVKTENGVRDIRMVRTASPVD